MTDTDRRADLAVQAAEAGAALALDSFRGELSVETKTGKTDLVTATDRAAQDRVIETIREGFPDDAIVGEEDDALKRVPDEGPSWVIDPIDGTSNFVRGLRIWGTSVTAVIDGEPVAAATVLPALSDTYVADGSGTRLNGDPVHVSDREDPETFAVVPILLGERRLEDYTATIGALASRFGDIRRFGCSHATLAAVAGGSLEAAVATAGMSPWDTVGGAHMIRQAGGTVTDLAGERWRHDSDGLVASNGAAHEELLAAVGREE